MLRTISGGMQRAGMQRAVGSRLQHELTTLCETARTGFFDLEAHGRTDVLRTDSGRTRQELGDNESDSKFKSCRPATLCCEQSKIKK